MHYQNKLATLKTEHSVHSFGPEYVKVFLKSSVFDFGICNFSHNISESVMISIKQLLDLIFYPLANEVAKGYSNATIRPSVTSLWTL